LRIVYLYTTAVWLEACSLTVCHRIAVEDVTVADVVEKASPRHGLTTVHFSAQLEPF
jgi:hypothetical protein